MKPAVGIVLGSSIVLCAATAYYLHEPTAPASGARAPATAAGARPVGCSFERGSTLAYELDSTVAARSPDGTLLPGADRLSAVVSAHVVASNAQQASLQLALSDVELRQELAQPDDRIEDSLTETFEIDVAASCRIVEFRLPQSWSDDARRLVAGALRTHEHVLQSEPTWEVDQIDAVGRYRAEYTRTEDATERRKVMYYDDEGLAAFGMKILVPHASARATFGVDGVLTSDVRERMQIRVGTEVRADLDQRSLLIRDDELYRAPAQASALAAVDPFAANTSEGDALPTAPTDPAEAWALYEKLSGELDPLSISQAHALAGLVAAYPSIADELVARLDGDDLSEVGRSSVFWVLELAGTDHARGHLTSLLEAPQPNDRIRAAVALSGAAPTLDTGQRLLAMYHEDTDPSAASAGLLALGVVGAGGDEKAKIFARDNINVAYEEAGTRGERLTALAAMGNTADEEFMPQLAESLRDEDPTVRAKAAEAMRGLGDEARPHLQAALESEVEAGTAKSVVQTLRQIGPPRGDELAWAADQLDAASSSAVRGELIEWLAADSSDEGMAILVARFHSEPSGALRQQIGRHVPASELRW